MFLALLVAMVALSLPDQVSRQPPDLRVVEASRFIGGRWDRAEWVDAATGSTRQESVGGPWTSECPLTVVSDGRLTSWSSECAQLDRERFRREHIWFTADFLLAKRLLAARKARTVASVNVGGVKAVRVALPRSKNPLMPIRFADVDPGSMLPLRFVYVVDGRTRDERVYIRRLPRAAFPRDFFTP